MFFFLFFIVKVKNELTSLSEQHKVEVDRGRNYKDELEQMKNVLRNCRVDLEVVKSNNQQLEVELTNTKETYTQKLNEQKITSDNDISALTIQINSLSSSIETNRIRHENITDALRAELSSAEATVGMLREQVSFFYHSFIFIFITSNLTKRHLFSMFHAIERTTCRSKKGSTFRSTSRIKCLSWSRSFVESRTCTK
jgi:hypothetical protein